MNKKRDDAREKIGFTERISARIGLPSDELVGKFGLEIRGRDAVFVHGCRRILKYTPSSVVLDIGKFEVNVIGRHLVCSAYYGGTVCIDGYVCGVELGDGEDENRI